MKTSPVDPVSSDSAVRVCTGKNRRPGSWPLKLSPVASACLVLVFLQMEPASSLADFFEVVLVNPGKAPQVAVQRQEIDWARGFDTYCFDVYSLAKGKRESSDCPKPETRKKYSDLGQFEAWQAECERQRGRAEKKLDKAGFKPLPQVLSLLTQGAASFVITADAPLMSVSVTWNGKVQVSTTGPEGQILDAEVSSLGDDPVTANIDSATVVVSQVAFLPGRLGLLVVVRVIPMPSPEREPFDVVRYVDIKPFCEQWSSPCSFEKARILAK